MTVAEAPIPCPRCGGDVDLVDEPGEFECRDCGLEFTDADYVESVAEEVRAAGWASLADELASAADEAREVKN